MNKIVESKRQTLRQLHRFIHLISSSHPEAERPNDKRQPGRSRTENSQLSVRETVPKLSPVRGRWGPEPLRTGWLWWLRWTSWSCRRRNSERQRPKPRTRWTKPRRVQQSPADSSQNLQHLSRRVQERFSTVSEFLFPTQLNLSPQFPLIQSSILKQTFALARKLDHWISLISLLLICAGRFGSSSGCVCSYAGVSLHTQDLLQQRGEGAERCHGGPEAQQQHHVGFVLQ